MGVDCEVVAPSLIPKGSSDRAGDGSAGCDPIGPVVPGWRAEGGPCADAGVAPRFSYGHVFKCSTCTNTQFKIIYPQIRIRHNVHLLHNSFQIRFEKGWAAIVRDLKTVHTAPSESAALDAFAEFSEKWEKKYPAIIRLWTSAWAEFVPFLAFDKEIRTIICATNAIVIWSGFESVFDVHYERLRSGDPLGGRGYLPPSITRIPCRFDACSAGGDARLAA
jgi:Transposase, Mutator family